MSERAFSLLTPDETVFARCRSIGQGWAVHRIAQLKELQGLPKRSLLAIDMAQPGLPALDTPSWRMWSEQLNLIVMSSEPNDEQGIAALEAGASAYCHSFSSPSTLGQMLEVVASGELWVGRALMSRLLQGVASTRQTAAPSTSWESKLTERERGVAWRAANGESNLAIAEALGITERTVKAHLSAIFEKLGLTDRLQLALRVHGIKPG